MKKLALTIICGLAITGAAFAQGTVNWNAFGSNVNFQTNSATSALFPGGVGTGGTQANAVAGNSYYYELLYNTAIIVGGGQVATPGTNALFNGVGGAWMDTLKGATNGPGSNGRLLPFGNSTAATIPWSQGTTNNVVLVGWSSNIGTTWAGVSNILAALAKGDTSLLIAQVGTQNAFFGETQAGYINPGPPTTGVTVFTVTTGNTAGGLPIVTLPGAPNVLYLLPVPEPSTMVLVGLGGLSLLLFRRRK
ncbi:MAG: PEP-CTERM sorting domain-containing protein [Verrucomicrobiota bacterium]|jgi:hypothetical protein